MMNTKQTGAQFTLTSTDEKHSIVLTIDHTNRAFTMNPPAGGKFNFTCSKDVEMCETVIQLMAHAIELVKKEFGEPLTVEGEGSIIK
jgi:hypothetical protein